MRAGGPPAWEFVWSRHSSILRGFGPGRHEPGIFNTVPWQKYISRAWTTSYSSPRYSLTPGIFRYAQRPVRHDNRGDDADQRDCRNQIAGFQVNGQVERREAGRNEPQGAQWPNPAPAGQPWAGNGDQRNDGPDKLADDVQDDEESGKEGAVQQGSP